MFCREYDLLYGDSNSVKFFRSCDEQVLGRTWVLDVRNVNDRTLLLRFLNSGWKYFNEVTETYGNFEQCPFCNEIVSTGHVLMECRFFERQRRILVS
jgi:hypothetical protein